MRPLLVLYCSVSLALFAAGARAEGEWEITPQSEASLEKGLQWLAANQGPEGNWESNDLGLVSMGALAFLAAGHTPGHGPYGQPVEKAISHVLKKAKPSGLLNIADPHRDMYNHGLSAFVLGQAYGMTSDPRISPVLDRALKLIAYTQCEDGGWDYQARRQKRGHDLSLAVMQAKALRGAVDSGLEVSPEVIALAIKSVREHYRAQSGKQNFDDPAVRAEPGHFTYEGQRTSLGLAACGVVCLQEFGEYDDWRIERNMEGIIPQIKRLGVDKHDGRPPISAYPLYYVGQAIYQAGGKPWEECYPILRDTLINSQHLDAKDSREDGWWTDTAHVSGKPGRLYGTSVACFILAIPNRYLPILQEGKIDSLTARNQKN